MADHAPSTPLGARAQGTASTSGGRHLKRLSLASSSSPAGQSPVSATSGSSPLSARTTPTGDRRSGHGVRGLRLSMSGALAPGSASSPHAASSTLPGTPLEGQPLADNRSTSPTTLRRSTSYRAAPAGTPTGDSVPDTSPLDSTTGPLRRSHSRRGASISYTGGTSLDGLGPGGGSGEVGGARHSLDVAGVEYGGRSRGASLSGVQEEEDAMPLGSTRAGSESLGAPSVSSAAGSPAAVSSNTLPAQATLVEQNADLLSFIAKKERKCLDLREELKRNELELALLKKKWESIVARSLQQQHVQANSPNLSHPRNASISTVSSASPNTSPTPRSAATLHPTHSLDLSLLSSTFDGGSTESPIEIPESVKAAGNWIGGALGRVLEAAVGMPPPTSDELDLPVTGLGIVQEEDEEEEREGEGERRRESKASSVETDSTASGLAGTRSTAPSSIASEETVSLHQLGESDRPARPTSPLRLKPAPPRSSSPVTSRQRLFTPPSHESSGSTHHPPGGLSHSRSRSTALDALSGGWSSLNRKWTQLSESDTVQNTRRATLGLVDTFEQGLAQALGPLEPPPLEPLPPPSPTRRAHPPRSSSMVAQAQHDAGALPDARALSPPQPASSASFPPPPASASPSPSHAAAAPLPGPVPGQGLASVFASFSKSPSLSASTRTASAVPMAEDERRPQTAAPAGWDWSAFLSGSSSTDGLAEQGSASKRSGDGRRTSVAASDTVDVEWPGW
ncbi:hypothetical protein JCM3770_003101 [Rhodotorula araucariae]